MTNIINFFNINKVKKKTFKYMSEKEFYNKIRLDENGKLITVVNTKTNIDTKVGNRYSFFKKIKLDDTNRIKIVFE